MLGQAGSSGGQPQPCRDEPSKFTPSSEGPQGQQEELREQTSSSHQHKTSLLCNSRRCNCFQPFWVFCFWVSKISDVTDWHWLKKHELSTGVTAGGWQNCTAAAAGNYNFRVIITKETSDPRLVKQSTYEAVKERGAQAMQHQLLSKPSPSLSVDVIISAGREESRSASKMPSGSSCAT